MEKETLTKYQTTLPDGRLALRTTKTKTYRFVVIAETEVWNESGSWKWGALRWSETASAAQSAASSFDRKPHHRNVRVLPLDP